MGEIGPNPRRIEVVPITKPVRKPAPEPQRQPVKIPEPQKVPA